MTPERLRVLHVIPSVSPRRGGPSAAVELMARGLTEAGVDVHVVTTDDDGADRRAPTPPECAGRFQFFPRELAAYTVSRPLVRWVRAHVREFDVVHTHAVFSHTSNAAARIAQRTGVPNVIRPLGTLAPYGLRQHAFLKWLSLTLIERRLLADADAVHCTSTVEAKEIRQLNAAWRTVVIPLGIEIDPAPPTRDRAWLHQHAPRLGDRAVILFLSRIDPKKGLDLLLDAFARLPESAAALVIAGAGDPAYTATLRERAHSLGVDDRVHWAGHVSGAEKRRLFAAADLFVLPSRAENFGIAAVEALAAGLPVVLSDEVGIHETVADGGAGVVVPMDVNALVSALRGLVENPRTRAAMAARAHLLAQQHFSLHTMAERLITLYRELSE